MGAAFELYLKAENKRMPIKIAWQRGSDAGVEFGAKLNWISDHLAASLLMPRQRRRIA
jgi:hypothetical protein